jgi:hypothetical protein
MRPMQAPRRDGLVLLHRLLELGLEGLLGEGGEALVLGGAFG